MTREDASAGVEHLQNAARELIAAARLFLDAAEDVVDDPGIVSEVGSTLRSVVSELTGQVDRHRRDWFDESNVDEATSAGDRDVPRDPDDRAKDDSAGSEGPADGQGSGSVPAGSARASSEDTGGSRAKPGRGPNGSASGPRVRRIRVD